MFFRRTRNKISEILKTGRNMNNQILLAVHQGASIRDLFVRQLMSAELQQPLYYEALTMLRRALIPAPEAEYH